MVITNAKILTRNAWISNGWIEISNGKIINYGEGSIDTGIDCKGAYLLPGLIDLHNCSLKSFIVPRRNSRMPQNQASSAHEVLCLKHGITTVFHTIRLSELEVLTENNASELEAGTFNVKRLTDSHNGPRQYLHLRCDLAWENVVDKATEAIMKLNPEIISFIRCCPGVGRFHTYGIFHDYIKDKAGIEMFGDSRKPSHKRMWERAYNIVKNTKTNSSKTFIIHDPSTPADIYNASRIGIDVAEFPVNMETVQIAINENMPVCMGAPNIINGDSQYGNLKAIDVWDAGALKLLTSDYYVPSLLAGIFKLSRIGNSINDDALDHSIHLSTSGPANILGWSRYGIINKNMNADLIAVKVNKDCEPEVKFTIVSGEIRYSQTCSI